MLSAGDVISYPEMCQQENMSLQKGMNFRRRGETSVILMSRRRDAPYQDQIGEDGRVLIYEGHDVPRHLGGPDPKAVDQPEQTPKGQPTENGRFFEAARRFNRGDGPALLVRVYEKIHRGIWAYNGLFRLTDARMEQSGSRRVFKFRLELTDAVSADPNRKSGDLAHERLIPTDVKLEVWKRDKGKCVKCGRRDNLHFDHDIPFSKGGTSLSAKNIRLLCARHNLEKSARIE
jgi:hypothetical protein